jgi:glutathione S-transferase
MGVRMLGATVAPEQKRMVGWGDMTDVVNALETALTGRDYITGDAFTAADVYVGSSLGWGMQFGAIDKRPAFERYNERMQNRPANIRAREIDDKLMAAAQAPA